MQTNYKEKLKFHSVLIVRHKTRILKLYYAWQLCSVYMFVIGSSAQFDQLNLIGHLTDNAAAAKVRE